MFWLADLWLSAHAQSTFSDGKAQTLMLHSPSSIAVSVAYPGDIIWFVLFGWSHPALHNQSSR